MKLQTGSFNRVVTAIKFSGRQKGCRLEYFYFFVN